MDSDLAFHIIAALGFLAGAAWFAAADQALDDANPQVLDGRGLHRAATQVRTPGHFRPPCRLLRIFATLALGATLASLLADIIGSEATGIALLVLAAPVVMIVAQSAPRAFGRAHPESVMRAVSPTVTVAALVVGPLARLGEAAGRKLVPDHDDGREADVAGEEQTPDREELRALAAHAVAHGALSPQERSYIDGVLDLQGTRVRALMTPRSALIVAGVAEELGDAVAAALTSGHVALPLLGTDGSPEGIIHLADMTRAIVAGDTQASLYGLASPALAVPESADAAAVLAQLQDAHTEMALVVDEYGQLTGLITAEDIVEEIVGEIESGRTAPTSRNHSSGALEVAGHLPLGDLADHDIALSHPKVTSVGGVINHELGRAGTLGDAVTLDDWTLRVVGVDGGRITRVRITRAPD